MLTKKNDNFGYRISSFALYAECPMMFKLAQEWEVEQTEAMRKGKLLERYLFGFKDGERELLEGKKKHSTLEPIKKQAENLKNYFIDVKSWDRMETIINGKKVSGEYDALGDIRHGNNIYYALGDCKNTGDIFRVWDDRDQKYEYIQAPGYNWLRWKNGLKIVPFIYVINDDSSDDFIVRTIKIDITLEHVLWFDQLVKTALNHDFYDFEIEQYNVERCKGRTYREPTCKYCTKCPYGKSLLTDPKDIDFNSLIDPLELKVNEQDKFDTVKQKKSKIYDPKMNIDSEIQESNIDELIKETKSLTYMQEEFKTDEPIKCRSCFKNTIKKGDDKCQNCHTKIKMI